MFFFSFFSFSKGVVQDFFANFDGSAQFFVAEIFNKLNQNAGRKWRTNVNHKQSYEAPLLDAPKKSRF